jgi:hypothetical protein
VSNRLSVRRRLPTDRSQLVFATTHPRRRSRRIHDISTDHHRARGERHAHVAPRPAPEAYDEERWDQERPVGDDVQGGYDRCVPPSMNRPWRSLILSSPLPASGRRRRWPGHETQHQSAIDLRP